MCMQIGRAGAVPDLKGQVRPDSFRFKAIPLICVTFLPSALLSFPRSRSIGLFLKNFGLFLLDFLNSGILFFILLKNKCPIGPSFYLNNSDGTFSDLSHIGWQFEQGMGRDTHGCAYGDVDNDGRQELFEIVGGAQGEGADPNNLFKYEDGRLRNLSHDLGLAYEKGRGRTPLWFDYDIDGNLDVLLVNRERSGAPTALFHQEQGGWFRDVTEDLDLILYDDWDFAQLTKCRLDSNSMDLLVWEANDFQAYDITQRPFIEVTREIGIPSYTNVHDVAIADFNGDLKISTVRSSPA